MTADSDSNSEQAPDHDRAAHRVLTVPNVLTAARLVSSGFLLWLAQGGYAGWFVAIFALLLLTDWLDGKISILLDQRTVLGARLDSIADAVLYACLLVGTAMLRPEFIRSDAILIGGMLVSYALTVIIALIRFGRLPAYHTRAAKTCWYLIAIGAIALVLGGPSWPVRIALIAVILSNTEASAISFVLTRPEVDIPSIWHAFRRARKEQ